MDQQLTIKVVKSSKDFEAFVRFPFGIYKSQPFWVPPLIKEEIETINPGPTCIQNADACFYLAYRGKEMWVELVPWSTGLKK